MDDPYTQTAKLLSPPQTKKASAPLAPSAPVSSMTVVGKKYTDPQSREDEEYMAGAQKRVEKRLGEGAERLSGEYRTRRFNDRRYGRRSGR